MDYFKKLGKAVITFIAIMFAIIVIIAVVQVATEENEEPVVEKQEKVIEEPVTEKKSIFKNTSDTIGEEVKQAYIDGCSESGTTSVTTCRCHIEYMDDVLTNEELISVMTEVIDTDNIPPIVWETIEFCSADVS